MIHHGNWDYLPGAFVAIDVFFALSGFLITALLLQELEDRGRIDFRAFFKRRALRLLPASSAFVAACLVIALVAMEGAQQERMLATLVTTAFYVANLWNAAALPVEYGHTWSLSAEEQFYAVWPFLLAFAFRGRGRRQIVTGVAAALAIAAVAPPLLYWAGARAGRWDALYFSALVHLQVIIVGVLIGIAHVWDLIPRWLMRPRTLNVITGAAWLLLIPIVIFVHPADEFMYSGGFALVAVACAGLVLAGTSERPVPLMRPLVWRPMVTMGIFSYAMYLWHPLLQREVVAKLPGMVAGIPFVIVGVVVSLIAGAASYRFVERPWLLVKARMASDRSPEPSADWLSELSFRPTRPDGHPRVQTGPAAEPASGPQLG